jgi:hypothetical protein
MKAAKIGLLVLILGFGGVIETAFAVRNKIGIGPAGCRVIQVDADDDPPEMVHRKICQTMESA